jgi:Phenazine biosynthesis-like protein
VRIRIIDAFTDRPFAGNPAVVCLLDADAWPDEAWMRQVAAEMNLSGTALAHSLPEKVDADWALRWFTTTVEGRFVRARHPGHRARSAQRLRNPRQQPVQQPKRNPDHPYPDFSALAQLARLDGMHGVIATAPAADPRSCYNFVSHLSHPLSASWRAGDLMSVSDSDELVSQGGGAAMMATRAWSPAVIRRREENFMINARVTLALLPVILGVSPAITAGQHDCHTLPGHCLITLPARQSPHITLRLPINWPHRKLGNPSGVRTPTTQHHDPRHRNTASNDHPKSDSESGIRPDPRRRAPSGR